MDQVGSMGVGAKIEYLVPLVFVHHRARSFPGDCPLRDEKVIHTETASSQSKVQPKVLQVFRYHQLMLYNLRSEANSIPVFSCNTYQILTKDRVAVISQGIPRGGMCSCKVLLLEHLRA